MYTRVGEPLQILNAASNTELVGIHAGFAAAHEAARGFAIGLPTDESDQIPG